MITIKGKVGKFINGSRMHYTEGRTQAGEYVYTFSFLYEGEWIKVKTQRPFIKHCKPFDSLEISGHFEKRFLLQKIFIAKNISMDNDIKNYHN